MTIKQTPLNRSVQALRTNTTKAGFEPGAKEGSGDSIFSQPPIAEEEYEWRNPLVYFQEGRAVSLFLLGCLYLLLALSMDAAGWVSNMGMVVPVVLVALTMGTLMAFSRFDGFFMISHSLSTGLAWVFYLMTRLVDGEDRVTLFMEHGVPELQARSYFLLERWLEWMQAAMSSSPSSDNLVFILEVSFLLWWLTYLGAWTVFRHGYVWRGVVMAGIAMLVNTYYAPEPVTGLLVIFFIVSLLLLVWTNLVSHRQEWRMRRIRFSQEISFDFMRDGTLYAVLVIGIAFITPNLGRSALFSQVLHPISQRWEVASDELNRLYQGINRQTRPVQAAFGRSLTLGGERNVSDRTILFVESPTGRYWRAVTYDTYTGREWLNTASVERNYDIGERTNSVSWDSRQVLTQTIRIVSPVGNVILGAPDIQRASVPMEGLLAPVSGPAETEELDPDQAEMTLARSQVNLEVDDSYTVFSSYTAVTERNLRNAGTSYPEVIRERYLQLSDDFSARVADLAVEIAGDGESVYDQAKAVEAFLRQYEYDDQISGPGPDQDPVEYFLFNEQRGYCNYYATSMAVMLRSLGIPARVASGYAEGTYDQDSGLFVLSDRDSHTWVEVYFPDYGWVEFEPTAGESVLDRPSGAELEESGRTPGMPDNVNQNQQVPQMDDLIEPQLQNLEEFERPFFGDTGAVQPNDPWLISSALLTLAAIIGGVWLMRRRLYQGPDAFEAEPPNLFYQRMIDWAQRLGLLLRPAQTPYERADELSRRLPGVSGLIRRIADIYVYSRYAPPRSYAGTRVADELAETWKQMRPVLWKAWFRRQLDRVLKR